jgi:hypothetical protein
MNEIIDSFINFINSNYKFIVAIIVSIFVLLIFISVKDINLNLPKKATKLAQSVTVETFNPMNQIILNNDTQPIPVSNVDDIITTDGTTNFCNKYSHSPKDLEQACNGLSHTTCKNMACCALIGNDKSDADADAEYKPNSRKCIAANKNGPIYKSDTNGKLVTMDHYYYEGTKYNIKQ